MKPIHIMTNQDSAYILEESRREVERLQKQHTWINGYLEGRIVFAPVDLSNPKLKVLDVGCADGKRLTN